MTWDNDHSYRQGACCPASRRATGGKKCHFCHLRVVWGTLCRRRRAPAYYAGMRFAISIPQFFGDGEFSPADFRAYFERAEAFGVYESAWAQEMTLGPSPQLAPLEAMTYAAACTSSLRLGCTVFVTTLHTPAHLAKGLATPGAAAPAYYRVTELWFSSMAQMQKVTGTPQWKQIVDDVPNFASGGATIVVCAIG